jgi:glutamate-1-semialdehyde 2,1-aminomutase
MTWQNRADMAIAQGALTNSKRPSTYVENVYPTHSRGGSGPHIYAAGKPFLDFVCGLGSQLLGYGNPAIAHAIHEQYLKGATLSLSSELEVELAEKLKGLFLFCELWKFTKSGTEACNAAIKIARAYNGRELVLSEGYHGHGDDFISMTPPSLGVPKRTWMKPIDFTLIPEAAAVIVEPVMLDWSDARKNYLIELQTTCRRHNTVLIFDEIITGFRFPRYCVSNYWGVQPDLILLGKAMGGGLPLSAIGGRREIMNCGEYFISGTFFGETVSMAACLEVINIVHRDGSKFSMKALFEEGTKFLDLFNQLEPKLKIVGYPSRGAFQGDEMTKALFWQECIKAGVLFGPSWFFSIPLAEYTEQLMPVFRDIFHKIRVGQVKLEGKMPRTPFAQKVRESGSRTEEALGTKGTSKRNEEISARG